MINWEGTFVASYSKVTWMDWWNHSRTGLCLIQ